jgi:hypothetical protein
VERPAHTIDVDRVFSGPEIEADGRAFPIP